MNKEFVLLFMLFCHVFDDYFLQGCLATLKQKKYWKENAPEEMYRNDYKMALVMHAISWSFMIMLPIAFYNHFNVDGTFIAMFIANAAIHAIIDDLKANRKLINLIYDQICHIVQIAYTFIYLVII